MPGAEFEHPSGGYPGNKLTFIIDTGCSLNIVFFPRTLESLPLPPRQHSAAIGCTKNYQPIGVTVHSHCVESFEGFLQCLQSDLGEGGVAVNCRKTHNFS